MLGFIYYVTICSSLVLYLIALKVFRIRFLSFSSISYFMAFLTAMLPGYEISNGAFYASRFSRGFDLEVYLLYMFFSVLFPCSIILGNIAGKKIYIYSEPRSNTQIRMKITLLLVLVYSIGYFLWIPQIPLNNLIAGNLDLIELAAQRIAVTHQLGTMAEKVPFLFRYWRNIMQNLLFIVFLYFLASNYPTRKHSRTFLAITLSFLVYNLSFTLEKASVVYVVMAVFFMSSMHDEKLRVKKLLVSSTIVISLSMFLINLFMGARDLMDLFDALFLRLTEQTCSTYIQIEYVRQNGFLLLRGIYIPFVKLFDPQYYVDLSRLAYEVIFPSNAEIEVIGSAAGMAFADLYFIASWFAVPLYFLIMFLYGFADSVFINSAQCSRLSQDAKCINRAFYVYFMSVFSLMLTGSVFSILSFPFIFSPVTIILIFFYFIYVKPSTVKLVKLKYASAI